MKFEENLRWWIDWLGQLIENDPHMYDTIVHLNYG